MVILREMNLEDYKDVLDMCKDIWDGSDYLPQVFNSWLADRDGMFIAAADTDTNKVIGTAKYTILSDGTGWLEGIRIHKAYRGKKIAKLLTERTLELTDADLRGGKIKKVAFSTHESAVESITMMKKYNFYLTQKHIIVHKTFDNLLPGIKLSDFVVKPWAASYEEFSELPFTARRSGIFHLAFYFQSPTRELYNYFKEHNCFVNINGYNGIYLHKGEPHFVTEEESFQAIDAFMNYYLIALKGVGSGVPLFSIKEEDTALIENLKAAGYETWTNWQSDYYYFVMK